MSAYEKDLEKNAANFQPLTPLSFLARAAAVYPDHMAIVHGRQRVSYAAFYGRCRRLASSLVKAGLRKGEVAKAFGVSPASLSRWLRPLAARDEHKGSGVPAALADLVERWIEGGPLPTAEELEAVSSRRGKARGSTV